MSRLKNHDGYMKADVRNLPKIDLEMVLQYIKVNGDGNIPETSGKKARQSMREDYVKNAIGWVEIKRENSYCYIRAKITPEYHIQKKLYSITSIIDEKKEEITDMKCDGCMAGNGNCKHVTAFLAWLLSKSTAPSVTQTECYWVKPKLSRATTNKVLSFGRIGLKNLNQTTNIKNKFTTQKTLPENIIYLDCMGYTKKKYESILIHNSILKFKEYSDDSTADGYLSVLRNSKKEIYLNACEDTILQSNNPLWFNLRYGRISASILYEASRSQRSKSLFCKILGNNKFNLTEPLKRGKRIENDVLEEVCKKMNIEFQKSGFLISNLWPNFGASPDGISSEAVLEIKAPFKEKSIENYFKNNEIMPKVKAQMQLQMYIFEKNKGYLAIASPNFEENKHVDIIEEKFDKDYIKQIMEDAHCYWTTNIFDYLMSQ